LQSLKCFTLCTIARGVAKANQLNLLKPGWADFAPSPGFIKLSTPLIAVHKVQNI